MQKAAAWNMPLAPAVAKTWGDYTKLPLEIGSTFYWWAPGQQELREAGSFVEDDLNLNRSRFRNIQTYSMFRWTKRRGPAFPSRILESDA